MIRALFRLIGLLLLAAGFVALVLDGVRWIATGAFTFAALGAVAMSQFPSAFPLLEPAVVRNVHPLLWDYGLAPLFAAPAFAALGGLGLLLLWLGRRPPPAIGFSPR